MRDICPNHSRLLWVGVHRNSLSPWRRLKIADFSRGHSDRVKLLLKRDKESGYKDNWIRQVPISDKSDFCSICLFAVANIISSQGQISFIVLYVDLMTRHVVYSPISNPGHVFGAGREHRAKDAQAGQAYLWLREGKHKPTRARRIGNYHRPVKVILVRRLFCLHMEGTGIRTHTDSHSEALVHSQKVILWLDVKMTCGVWLEPYNRVILEHHSIK